MFTLEMLWVVCIGLSTITDGEGMTLYPAVAREDLVDSILVGEKVVKYLGSCSCAGQWLLLREIKNKKRRNGTCKCAIRISPGELPKIYYRPEWGWRPSAEGVHKSKAYFITDVVTFEEFYCEDFHQGLPMKVTNSNRFQLYKDKICNGKQLFMNRECPFKEADCASPTKIHKRQLDRQLQH